MLVYESPGWEWMENIRTDTFQPKIFGSKLEKKEFVYFSKSPGWKEPNRIERTLFSQKYFV